MLECLEHMQIPVRHLHNAVEWYTSQLGFQLQSIAAGRHAFLTLPTGPMLMLWETADATAANFTVRGDDMPVLLYRTSAIAALHDRLLQAGAKIALYQDEGFGWVLKFYDPSGNLWGTIQQKASGNTSLEH